MNAMARDFFYESTDGLRLYCAVYGAQCPDGLPVLCLPGLTRNSRDFAKLAARLSRQHPVLAIDLRGRGLSAWDADSAHYELATYVRDVWALLDCKGVDRFVAIGTSLGGLIAMTMAAMQPTRVAGAILNDIGPEIDPAGLRRIGGYVGRLPPVRDWNEAIAQTKSVYGLALPGLTDEEWSAFARCGYRESEADMPAVDADPRIATAFNRPSRVQPDLWSLFGRLTAPLLAIRGGLSDILSRDTLNRMIQEKPDLAHVTLAQRGHTPLLDEPECLMAIDEFLMRYGRRS
jgi:pimeloyl-ACP methyl ester carboxylesterase